MKNIKQKLRNARTAALDAARNADGDADRSARVVYKTAARDAAWTAAIAAHSTAVRDAARAAMATYAANNQESELKEQIALISEMLK